jgi:subtilisin family serine protease
MTSAATAAALGLSLGLSYTARAAGKPESFDPSRGCTIVGTSAGDVLKGTDGDDVICGGGGGDTIKAGAGNDIIYGDGGGDTIYGGAGDDIIYGSDGADTIRGEDGNDIIYGEAGGDTIHGGAGVDHIWGGDGGDTLWGEAGDDIIQGEAGADTVRAGGGEDVIVDTGKADTLWGDDGHDIIVAGDGADSVKGNAGDDLLFGGPGNDSHYGDGGTDTCVGGAGVNAFYSCERRLEATNLGGGTDEDVDGDGVSNADEALNHTDPLTPDQAALSYRLEVPAGCSAALSLQVVPQQDLVTEGSTALFDVTVRNDPTGGCLKAGQSPTAVAGVLNVATSDDTQDAGFESVVAWLEIPDPGTPGRNLVLPRSSGLTTTDKTGGAGCPGSEAAGCGLTLGDVVGYVDVAGGQAQQFVSGEAKSVAIRYFPVLDPADLALLSGDSGLRLAVGIVEGTGSVVVVRQEMSFVSAQPTGRVTVNGEVPDGVSQIEFPDIAAGDQATAEGVFPYTPGHEDGHEFTGVFTATAPTVSDPAVATAVVGVESDRSDLSPVYATIYPQRATVGHEKEFTVSVHPRGQMNGPLTITWESGDAELTDDGLGGDLTPGNGVYTAKFVWAPTVAALHTLTVSGVVDGRAAASDVQVSAYDESLPTGSYTGPLAEPLAYEEAELCSDLVAVYGNPDVDPQEIVEAAESVNGQVVGTFLLRGWLILIAPATDWGDLNAVLGQLTTHPSVQYAEPIEMSSASAVEPNDTWFLDQENLQAFGMRDAWAFNSGRIPTTVAVLDVGFDTNHPDLDDSIIGGWDFAENDANVDPGTCGFHGTHVAGIIGAESDNGIGVTGVNWNVDLLAQKVFRKPWYSSDCKAFSFDLADAIWSSVAEGAQVLNLSLSSSLWSIAEVESLDTASNSNVVVVAAAGNQASSHRRYPAGYERVERLDHFVFHTDVISVGSVDRRGNQSDFSNFGDWVQVWAPGESEPDGNGGHTGVLSTDLGGGYVRAFGTSMAAPFVSGVASLILSFPGYGNLGSSYVRSRLTSSSVRRPGPLGGSSSQESGSLVHGYFAVSNASFESDLATVVATGTVETISALGSVKPVSGEEMLSVSTGPGSAESFSTASWDLAAPVNALSGGILTISLCYDYVTEEYPEFVGTQFNDTLRIRVVLPNGVSRPFVDESVNTTAWTRITGINFPGGDTTVGHSGWKCPSIDIPAADLQQPHTSVGGWAAWPQIRLEVADAGDDIYDSVALLDLIAVG